MPRIEVVLGDLTAFPADAVVNAANSSLLGGGGVDGAIHRAGGPAVLAECRELRAGRLRQGLATGQAVATGAGRLPARHVIHVVGPVYQPERADELRPLLASCYREALWVADELGDRTVAFPAVSAGAYGWPLADAARTAVQAVRGSGAAVDLVTFVLLHPPAHRAFTAALAEPPATP